MNFHTKLALALIFCATMVAASQASSITVSGSAWINQSGIVGDAVLANVPGTTPDVTFQVITSGDMVFDSRFPGSTYTLGTFLSTGLPPASSVVENTAGALAGTLNSVFFDFTATIDVTSGEKFTVTHDDGASFYIDGTLIPGIGPGPTGAVTATITYTGPTLKGAKLEIVYGECCGSPAVFETNLPTGGTTPEPSTLAMVGTGMLGLAGAFRRKLMP